MTKIHVNQHVIRRNAKTGECEPVITVKSGKTNQYAHAVVIHGPSRVVYQPDDPLSCGAKVWIETDAEVTLITCITSSKSLAPLEASCGTCGTRTESS